MKIKETPQVNLLLN